MPKQQVERPARRAGGARPPKPASRFNVWIVGVVAAVAVLLVAGLVLFGQSKPQPTETAAPTSENVKGDPAASVEIEEWGDFQ